jgi:O-antigen chain-terminating methyltransferase
MNFEEFAFNPYQFAGPDWWMKDFHKRHVSYFKGCKKVLDLGAGKGFFLEELRSIGIEGIGVESHSASYLEGEAKGLAYIRKDIFSFFSNPEGLSIAQTCDGVYCAHVIEHLEPEEVFRLFRCVKEFCHPNVRARFVTNNPQDIDVLGSVFWADLTHKRLYPGPLLEAMAKGQGFTRAVSKTFLGTKIGKRAQVRRIIDRIFWGPHKWLPNILLDVN